tara:strand:+ start:538 stop:1017 length:480 start_codon:yes stop_codon:yes gene_type:complete
VPDHAPAFGPGELRIVATVVDSWLRRELAENPVLAAVERESEPGSSECRWFIRIVGEEKDVSTIRLTLRQRMLHYETYVMPAPEENQVRFYEHLLRRNRDLVGAAFCVGEEDAVFLVGAVPVATVEDAELDRIVGTIWTAIERCFRPAMRIGFPSRISR